MSCSREIHSSSSSSFDRNDGVTLRIVAGANVGPSFWILLSYISVQPEYSDISTQLIIYPITVLNLMMSCDVIFLGGYDLLCGQQESIRLLVFCGPLMHHLERLSYDHMLVPEVNDGKKLMDQD